MADVEEIINLKISVLWLANKLFLTRFCYRQPKRDLRKENVNCGPRNHFLFPPFGSWALTYSSRISFPSLFSSSSPFRARAREKKKGKGNRERPAGEEEVNCRSLNLSHEEEHWKEDG